MEESFVLFDAINLVAFSLDFASEDVFTIEIERLASDFKMLDQQLKILGSCSDCFPWGSCFDLVLDRCASSCLETALVPNGL